ncbi:MAG: glycosyltransferase family 4 protein [Gemmatimonadaceae bacterium]|nr:glycosyltransferase family 4 protein [Gemmatimonadaceae bacterium]
MRLLFLETSGAWTGASRIFTAVAHALATRGHETAILGPEGSDLVRSARTSRARVFELEGERRRTGRDAAQLAARLVEFPADTVFVHGDASHLVAARALTKTRKGLLVRRLGAGETLEPTRRTRQAEKAWPVRYLYTTETPRTGHAAPSGTMSALRADLGVPVPDGPPAIVDDGYAVLACIATREALRRATNVLRAGALLAHQHPGLRLRVIGSAASDPDLQVLASALGLARRVEWFSQAASIGTALEGASAGWVVADGDDAGLGMLQLMAHGVVPLAERTPVAMRYVTPSVHGILMATLDPPAMAAETTLLLADRERRATMGAAGRARVEREFTLRDMLAGFEQAARGSRDRRTPA